MPKILSCVDGSVYSESVADHTRWAAGQLSASVDLLHMLGRRRTTSAPVDLSGNLDAGERETLLAELAELDAQSAKIAQKRGRLVLAQAAERIREGGIEVSELLRHGDVVDTLKELEGAADLIVIGKRGEASDFAKMHLGSNLERVLRGSTKPVLVASRAYRPIGRFLIAYDGGPSTIKAVDYLSREPLLAGAACTICIAGPRHDQNQRRLLEAEDLMKRAGFDVTGSIVEGNADDVIAQKVEDASVDLLVMGAYGHSRIRSLIIGSTTTTLIRSCLVPVLLFR